MDNTIRTRTRLGVGVTALSAAFLAGVAVATGVPGGDRATVDEPLRLAHAALRPAASCEELRQWYVDRALEQVTAWGWVSPYPIYYSDVLDTAADASVGGGVPESPTLSPRDAVTSSRTGTNVQEAGVDEPDTVKTDGALLVTVEGTRLTTYDLSGAAPELLASILLPGMQDAELLLSGDTVVAIGPDTSPSRRHPVLGGLSFGRGTLWHSDTRVTTVDVGDPAAPRITDSRVFDAGTVGVRLHEEAGGGVARLVLSAGLPDLPFVTARGGRRSQLDALERNRQVVRDTTIEDWLPSVQVGLDDSPAPVPAVDCADVALPDGSDSMGTVLVVAFPADDPGAAESTAVVADTQTAYFSDDRLYLADSTSAGGWWGIPRPAPLPLPSPVAPPGLVAPDAPDGSDLEGPDRDEPGPAEPGPEDSEIVPMPPVEPQPIRPIAPPSDTGTTRLYSFELDQTATRYVAAGEVEGSVRDRWAMDAVGGSLRLAVGPTIETGNYNSIVTLAEREGELVETGRVDALGVGEEIKSVRWFDDLVVLVTFRQVDPLYAVSLADPTRPRVLGELKIPGFSEYLHPIGEDRLIGVGQDASWSGMPRGAQLGLFDLSDLTSPRRLDTVGFGRSTRAMAGLDPRQFTWLADRSTALTVVADDRDGTGDVVITRVVGDRLETRSTQVESGRDVTRVRLVPLPDGRVVLWTGSTVTFLDLG